MRSSRVGPLAPTLDTIPNEIVLRIIKFGIPTQLIGLPTDLPSDLLQSDGSPMSLSGDTIFIEETTSRLYVTYTYGICAVNRHIRNLVLGDPSFWQWISINTQTKSNEIKLWVERSQKQPLDICIHLVSRPRTYRNTQPNFLVPTCSEPMYAADARMIFGMLETHSKRWGSLTIVTSCEHDMAFFTERLAIIEKAPLLRKICLLNAIQCDYEYHILPDNDIHTPFKGNYPLLTDISLTGSSVFINLPQMSAAPRFDSYYRCNILDLSEIDVTLTRIQMVSSTLTRLSITTFGFQSLPTVTGPVHIPNLKHLDITFWGADKVVPIIQALRLPKLRVLGIVLGDGEADNFWNQIQTRTGILPMLFNQLTTLITTDFPSTLRQADYIIRTLPRLENLVVRKRAIDQSPIFRRLAKLVDLDPPPCPNLANIVCDDANPKSIRDLMTNRTAMGVPITSFHISIHNALLDRDITWLKHNVNFIQHPPPYLS